LKLDATLRGIAPEEVASWAQRCEALGFAGLFSTETNNDPFLPLVLAAGATGRVELGTGVALAFPRSPMQVAYTGWDLQGLTQGRFVLGLGTQVRAHVERRFSAPWDRPAARMADFARAVRAIWTAWSDGTPLDYQGDFYRHTLMPPDFRPRPHSHGIPPILLAGVRPRMIEIAGEVADGLLVHPLQTPRFVRDSVLPAIERGLERSGRGRDAFELSVCLFTATSDEESEDVRRRIAFYASTPGYRHVLEPDGWGELCERLHQLSRTGGWDEMPGLVPDELLDAVCVRAADGAAVAAAIAQRYDGLAGRVNLHVGRRADPERWAELAAALPDAVGAADAAATAARP
jgi:probable F420-dependent oxidoreductase